MKFWTTVVVLLVAVLVGEVWAQKVPPAPTPGVFEMTCTDLSNFIYHSGNSAYMKEHGRAMAQSLLRIFNEPRDKRGQAALCNYPSPTHEGMRQTLSFQDGAAVMKVVSQVLRASGYKPRDIGRTYTGISEILRNDIVGHVELARGMGEEAWKLRPGSVSESVWSGMKFWDFSQNDLRLTDDEMKMVVTVMGSDPRW